MKKVKSLLSLVLLGLALASSVGCSLFSGPEHKTVDPRGYSGKYNTEAEKHFTMAHSMWGKKDTSSDPEKAITLLTEAIRIEPNYAEAYLWRGLAKSELGQWDEAFDDITKSIRLKPLAGSYAYRGLVSMRGGNAIGARKDFNESIELDSSQHRAYNFRGALELLLGDKPAACKDFSTGCSNGDCTGIESAKEAGYCK